MPRSIHCESSKEQLAPVVSDRSDLGLRFTYEFCLLIKNLSVRHAADAGDIGFVVVTTTEVASVAVYRQRSLAISPIKSSMLSCAISKKSRKLDLRFVRLLTNTLPPPSLAQATNGKSRRLDLRFVRFLTKTRSLKPGIPQA